MIDHIESFCEVYKVVGYAFIVAIIQMNLDIINAYISHFFFFYKQPIYKQQGLKTGVR